jgi:hypothetical protein
MPITTINSSTHLLDDDMRDSAVNAMVGWTACNVLNTIFSNAVIYRYQADELAVRQYTSYAFTSS